MPDFQPAMQAVLDGIERDREALYASVASVPPEAIGARLAPDAWSVGEVLDHLHRVEAGVAKLLAVRVSKGRAAGTLLPARPETEEELAAAIAHFEGRTAAITSRPLVAPEMVRPQAEGSKEALLDALRASRAALLAAAADGAAYDLAAVRHPHPTLGDMDLREWIVFLGRHERRHVAQIEAVKRALAEGSARA
jgi:uncharacterized damage-inducible protein DinB